MRQWLKKWGRWLVVMGLALVIVVVGEYPDGKLHIVACDVGQGDGILVKQGFKEVLIDAGPRADKILTCLQEEMPFWDRQIELIVMTHDDRDHMGGMYEVIKRYKVIEFVTGDGVRNGAEMRRLAQEIVRKKIQVRGVEVGDVVRVEDEGVRGGRLEFRVVWPKKLKREKLAMFSDKFWQRGHYQILGASAKRDGAQSNNNRSVVMELDWHGYRALFTGDAEYQAEKEMVEEGLVGRVDYLKIGHHGSNSSSSREFLEVVRPKVVVISVGQKNRYGHPREEVLARLREVGAKVRRTDQEGKVEVVVK